MRQVICPCAGEMVALAVGLQDGLQTISTPFSPPHNEEGCPPWGQEDSVDRTTRAFQGTVASVFLPSVHLREAI